MASLYRLSGCSEWTIPIYKKSTAYVTSTNSNIYNTSTNDYTWATTASSSVTADSNSLDYNSLINEPQKTRASYSNINFVPHFSLPLKTNQTLDNSWRTYYPWQTYYDTPDFSYKHLPSYGNAVVSNYYPTKQQAKRLRLRQNLAPQIKTRGNGFDGIIENHEQVAVETLREEITEAELRKYLRYGFVLVKGASGKTYQIFRNSWHTKVWLGGKLIEEVCVRLDSAAKAPPTDNVIAFKRMVEVDESEFRKCGNVYNLQKKVVAA